MTVISTEWHGGCGKDWFFNGYRLLQPEWSEEISRESELLTVGCWLLAA